MRIKIVPSSVLERELEGLVKDIRACLDHTVSPSIKLKQNKFSTSLTILYLLTLKTTSLYLKKYLASSVL